MFLKQKQDFPIIESGERNRQKKERQQPANQKIYILNSDVRHMQRSA